MSRLFRERIVLSGKCTAVQVRHAVNRIAQVVERHEDDPHAGDAGASPHPPRHDDGNRRVQMHRERVRPWAAQPRIPSVRRDVPGQSVVLLIGPRPHPRIDQHPRRSRERIHHRQQDASGADVPAHVRIPEPLMERRVRVQLRVGVLVMISMVACPLDGRARRKADRHQSALEPQGQFQRSVRQDAVIAEVHPKPGQLVVREHEEHKGRRPHQKCPISSSCSA